jgi:hypothetical protein
MHNLHMGDVGVDSEFVIVRAGRALLTPLALIRKLYQT